MNFKKLVLLIAVIGTTFSSCKKDDKAPETVLPQNELTFAGEKIEIKEVEFYYNKDSKKYTFFIGKKNPTNAVYLTLSEDYINKKIALSNTLDESGPEQIINLYLGASTNYRFSNKSALRTNKLSGTDNWFKITTNSTNKDEFTIEFGITFEDGKRLVGHYSGKFAPLALG